MARDLFDRTTAGLRTGPVACEVEAGRALERRGGRFIPSRIGCDVRRSLP